MGLWQQFFQQTVNGLALGSIYALIGLGYTMVYGIVQLINFAHGDILMLGAFVGFFVLVATGTLVTPLGFIIAFIVSMVVCGIIGIVIERTCYKPLRNAPRINALITAIGVSIFIQNGARVIPQIGSNPRQYPTLPNVNWELAGVGLSRIQALVFLVSIAMMVVLNYVVNYTKIGTAMRAVSYDRNAAYLMGIDVNKIISFTFAIGSSLAGAAGILFASAYPQVEPYMGIMPGLKAFVAAVLGGIGSIPGAMVGEIYYGYCRNSYQRFYFISVSRRDCFWDINSYLSSKTDWDLRLQC